MQLLCSNVVADFDAWWAVFRSHENAHETSGLRLLDVWRNLDEPNEVFFLFDVEDRDRALAFMSTPEAAEAGRVSGVLEGDYRFVTSVERPANGSDD